MNSTNSNTAKTKSEDAGISSAINHSATTTERPVVWLDSCIPSPLLLRTWPTIPIHLQTRPHCMFLVKGAKTVNGSA